MLDKKDIEEMEKYLKIEDSQREELIIRSRSILKASKTAIYCIHRKELESAKSNI
jgi:predicted translin family RNA/ssDNA-binding protein